MSAPARLNRRLTQLAVGRHLPHGTVRARLTLLYGGLFLVSGAALMAITYALLVNAGFVFTLQDAGPSSPKDTPSKVAHLGPLRTGSSRVQLAAKAFPSGLPRPGSMTHPSAATLVHWRAAAACMRQHGVAWFPDPTTSVPANFGQLGQLEDRGGALFEIPASRVPRNGKAYGYAENQCGFATSAGTQTASDDRQRAQTRNQLLLQSGIALAAMSLLSIGLGWLVAGRVLQPLEEAYQAQRQFVANASHELRAPLTRQRALIQVALADPQASFASLHAAHERVLASERHLERMIDGLLALSRGQAGIERREQLDLAALTSQAIQAHEPQPGALTVHTSLQPAPTAGDSRLLERLIANLIDNAIRHNTPGGQLEITTGTRDRHALISVENTGPTIQPDQIQRLFEPFQRLDGARTSHNHGHGLGLSIVQAIAKAHHAELIAKPRPGGGLAVELSFPLTVDPRMAGRENGSRQRGEPR
jgi:signal transduction histidine kinase